jgi:hypothetical protein
VGVAIAGFSLSGIYGLRPAAEGLADGWKFTKIRFAPDGGLNGAKYMIFRH